MTEQDFKPLLYDVASGSLIGNLMMFIQWHYMVNKKGKTLNKQNKRGFLVHNTGGQFKYFPGIVHNIASIYF